MASSLLSKCSVSCAFMSPEEVQPIKGSIARGCSGSYSSRHSLVEALPDCIAFLAGLKMRAVMDGPVENCVISARVVTRIRTANALDLIGDSRSGCYVPARYNH